MKTTKYIPLALAIGVACLQPLSLKAEDQDQNNQQNKETRGAHANGNGQAQTTHKVKPGAQTQAVQPGTTTSKQTHAKYDTNNNASTNRNEQRSNMNSSAQNTNGGNTYNKHVTSNSTSRSNTNVVSNQSRYQNNQTTVGLSVQGNRSNHYNNQWVAANVHSDWDHGTVHVWNNHHYRWYDGGWLIVNVAPSGGYYGGGSIGSAVQERLSDRGYYNGPVDGDIGPGTRHAIANYQGDNGLPVTGHIDDPLLDSLGLRN